MDNVKDYALLILGVGVTAWGVWDTIKHHKRASIRLVGFSVFLTLFLWLAIDQVSRNKREQRIFTSKIDSISGISKSFESQLIQLTGQISELRKRDQVFENKLLAQFKIARDSIRNTPVSVTNSYHTKIGKAENVKIGGN